MRERLYELETRQRDLIDLQVEHGLMDAEQKELDGLNAEINELHATLKRQILAYTE